MEIAGLPLHPLVVHFPIVLTFLLPISVLAALWVIRKGTTPRRAWAVPVALAAALSLSAFAAVETGENEEDRVERVVGDAALISGLSLEALNDIGASVAGVALATAMYHTEKNPLKKVLGGKSIAFIGGGAMAGDRLGSAGVALATLVAELRAPTVNWAKPKVTISPQTSGRKAYNRAPGRRKAIRKSSSTPRAEVTMLTIMS